MSGGLVLSDGVNAKICCVVSDGLVAKWFLGLFIAVWSLQNNWSYNIDSSGWFKIYFLIIPQVLGLTHIFNIKNGLSIEILTVGWLVWWDFSDALSSWYVLGHGSYGFPFNCCWNCDMSKMVSPTFFNLTQLQAQSLFKSLEVFPLPLISKFSFSKPKY